MFSYSPFNSTLFSKQSWMQFEISKNLESLKFIDILDFFFISYPKLGQKEGTEHERIMYFYPDSESLDKKTDITGFAEAVVNFTGEFNKTETPDLTSDTDYCYRYVNSANTSEIILSIENGTFLVGACLNRKLCKANDYIPHFATLKTVLCKIYETYRLFNGTFTHLFFNNFLEFKQTLNNFFNVYLTLVILKKIPLIDLFFGVDFMRLNSVDYLEVECFATRCLTEVTEIKHTMFFYREKLIQYSVKKTDLIPLTLFLSQNVIPYTLCSVLQPELKNNNDETLTGFFVKKVEEFLGIYSSSSFPIVYLSVDDNKEIYKPFELIVYHALNATMCVFVSLNSTYISKKEEFLNRLAKFIDNKICLIASRIGNDLLTVPKTLQNNINFNFIYYNPDSLSVGTSFTSAISSKQLSNIGTIPSNIYKLIYDTYDHFASNTDDFAQVYVKADNDWWIVFKKLRRRILLLFILLTTSSTIQDINVCAETIIKSYFSHIFVP